MLRTGLRERSPAQTAQLAQAQLARMGVSRLADVTRMDGLGVPVWISIRPRGRILSVHAGKGLDSEQARVGAMMEALEHAGAEPHRSRRLAVEYWTAQELQAAWQGRFRLADLAPPLGRQLDAKARWATLRCESLGAGPEVPLPAELIFLPWSDEPGELAFFGATGNGLASGNSVQEASVHALLELLERDAVAMNAARDESRYVPVDSLPAPWPELTAGWARDGVELLVREIPNAFGLPCFEAVLHQPRDHTIDLAGGWGLHPNPAIAVNRAICEAAQSRVGLIHGGRDDVTGFFGKFSLPQAERDRRTRRLLQRLRDRRRQAPFAAIAPAPWDSFVDLDEVLARLLAALAGCGMPHVYRHVFDVDLGGLAVVKLIVPGLEHLEQPVRRMGPRLLNRVIQDA